MRLHTTGFVASKSGSVASANALILRELLANGHQVTFYTKPSFVDPRLDITEPELLKQIEVVDCTNRAMESLWRYCANGNPHVIGSILGRLNAWTYNAGLVRFMGRAKGGDVDLWLGDWSHGRQDRPVVSFVQGPPGTDAESIRRHKHLIVRLAGNSVYLKLLVYAIWRLGFGLPRFQDSDTVIVGSEWSRNKMVERFGIQASKVHAIPYPIDLDMFKPSAVPRERVGRLRLLWLGRFVPRKRLDLLLDGMELAIRQGCDAELWVIGQSGFVKNYERLLSEFAFPERLYHRKSLPREQVPALLSNVDVLVQPSEDENFGSSVAEALACGIPSIVGPMNGTSDYICGRSIRMENYQIQTMAEAIVNLSERKKVGELEDRFPSRLVAERYFHPAHVNARLDSILRSVVA